LSVLSELEASAERAKLLESRVDELERDSEAVERSLEGIDRESRGGGNFH